MTISCPTCVLDYDDLYHPTTFPGTNHYNHFGYLDILGSPKAILRTLSGETLGRVLPTINAGISPLARVTEITSDLLSNLMYGYIVPLSSNYEDVRFGNMITTICQNMQQKTWEQIEWSSDGTPIELTVIFTKTTRDQIPRRDRSEYKKVYTNFAKANGYFMVPHIYGGTTYMHKSKFPDGWDFTLSFRDIYAELHHLGDGIYQLSPISILGNRTWHRIAINELVVSRKYRELYRRATFTCLMQELLARVVIIN